MIVRGRMVCRFNEHLLDKPCRETEHVIAVQAEKDTRPFVPKRTGGLVARTDVEGNRIVYRGPGVRALYFGRKVVDPDLKSVGFPIGNGEYRSRKGVKKVRSQIKKYTYSSGGAFWFAESKKKNIGKWAALARKEISKRV